MACKMEEKESRNPQSSLQDPMLQREAGLDLPEPVEVRLQITWGTSGISCKRLGVVDCVQVSRQTHGARLVLLHESGLDTQCFGYQRRPVYSVSCARGRWESTTMGWQSDM